MPVCRNWQTTATQNRVEKSVWVRVPPPAPPSLPVFDTKLVGSFFTPSGQKVPVARGFPGDFAELYGLGDAYLNKKSGAEDWSRSLRRFILPHWRISRERVAISLNCVQIYRNVNIWIILRSIDWCSMHSEFFSHIEPRCGRIESPVSASSPSLPIARIRVLLCFLVLFLWFDSWLFPRSVLQSS